MNNYWNYALYNLLIDQIRDQVSDMPKSYVTWDVQHVIWKKLYMQIDEVTSEVYLSVWDESSEIVRNEKLS